MPLNYTTALQKMFLDIAHCNIPLLKHANRSELRKLLMGQNGTYFVSILCIP
jgi:hypothetical protein